MTLFLLLAPLVAAQPSAHTGAEAQVDHRSHIDQARLFLRKELLADAQAELEAAVTTDDGLLDAEAWYMLARVRYVRRDLAGARFAADRAYVHSRIDAHEQIAREFMDHLATAFGELVLEPPRESVSTALEISLQSRILDPELKRWVHDVVSALPETVTLPHILGLPAGTYLVNGVETEVTGSASTHLTPPIRGHATSWQTLRFEVSLGGSAWFGRRTANLLPAATVGLALGGPIGPIEIAAVGDWTPRSYSLANGDLALGMQGGAVGLRLGIEIPGEGALRVRPSVSWKTGLLPGVESGCAGNSEESYSCGTKRDAVMRVYPVSLVHRPAAELASTWLPRDRAHGVGIGARFVTEGALGHLPPRASARDVTRGDLIPYAVRDTRWSALGIRILVDLTYAF